MKPHKHAELIKAWADGAEISIRWRDEEPWQRCQSPRWDQDCEYRITPTIKPDRVHKVRMWAENIPNGTFGGVCSKVGLSYSSLAYYVDDANLKLTFDGETGKLKLAEVL